jgi:hypothetical protein
MVVSVESRTSLCQHREFLPGKRLPRAGTGAAFLATLSVPRLRRQSRGRLKVIRTAPGNRSCAGLRGGERTPNARKRRPFRRLAAKSPFSGEEIRASRTEGGEIRSESLLCDFSISEIWIGSRPETGSNPQEIRRRFGTERPGLGRAERLRPARARICSTSAPGGTRAPFSATPPASSCFSGVVLRPSGWLSTARQLVSSSST